MTYSEEILELIDLCGDYRILQQFGDVETLLSTLGEEKKQFFEGYFNERRINITKDNLKMLISPIIANLIGKNFKVTISFRGFSYVVTVTLHPTYRIGNRGNDVYYKVAAQCGDYGFGHFYITNRNEFGPSKRRLVFNEILKRIDETIGRRKYE
jgi:hypothetical protein